jgi:aspartate-semialdehyde dehydrogenase
VFLVGALRPLQDLGVIEHVNVVTMQSLSGAGYPGVPSFDLIGNVIPHISGEEDKIQAETKKILGEVESPARFGVTVHVHRVPVLYGHLVALHVRFASAVTARDVRAQFTAWNEKFPGLFVIHDRPDRPQPARDLSAYDMSFHVGRIKQGDDPRVVGLVSLGHNLVRGAAGAAIANMEAFLNSSEAE